MKVFFLFPFDLSQVGSPPQNVFDFLQEDVSKEAFYDKPSWVDPESDACNSLLSQPACSFSRLFFQLGWGFLLSLCMSLFAEETNEYTLFSVDYTVRYSVMFLQLQLQAKKSQGFKMAKFSTVWEDFNS